DLGVGSDALGLGAVGLGVGVDALQSRELNTVGARAARHRSVDGDAEKGGECQRLRRPMHVIHVAILPIQGPPTAQTAIWAAKTVVPLPDRSVKALPAPNGGRSDEGRRIPRRRPLGCRRSPPAGSG